jgi:hypothetical protein
MASEQASADRTTLPLATLADRDGSRIGRGPARAYAAHRRRRRQTCSTTGGRDVIVMFTARRLKPGAWDQFRRAWDPGEDKPPGFQRAYHAQNIRDADEIISFGLFDMSIDDYHRWRGEADAAESQRVDRLSAFVENEHVSGVFEVVDVVDD